MYFGKDSPIAMTTNNNYVYRVTGMDQVEDIIISGLITNAPKQVIIHHKENCLNTEFIDTIVNVFGDRVFYCAGCANCESTKLKNIKLNN